MHEYLKNEIQNCNSILFQQEAMQPATIIPRPAQKIDRAITSQRVAEQTCLPAHRVYGCGRDATNI